MARRSRWSDRLMNDSIGVSGSANFNLLPTMDIDERTAITVVRMIIHINAFASPTSGIIGVQRLDMGIGIVSVDALTAAAVPDPNDEDDRPSGGWLWRDRIPVLDDSIGVITPTISMGDIRAKRRVSSGQLILTAINTTTAGGGFSISLVGIIRTLVLLP